MYTEDEYGSDEPTLSLKTEDGQTTDWSLVWRVPNNDFGKLHREWGPAVCKSSSSPNGSLHWNHWCMNDKLHREDGPAHIRLGDYNYMPDGLYESPYVEPFDQEFPGIYVIAKYYIKGEELTLEEFKNRYQFIFMKEFVPPTKKELLRSFVFAQLYKKWNYYGMTFKV